MAQAYSFMATPPKAKNTLTGDPSTGTVSYPGSQPKTGTGTTFPTRPSAPTNQLSVGSQWSLPAWNGQIPSTVPSRNTADVSNPGSPSRVPNWSSQFNTDQLYNPASFNEPNSPYSRMLENSLPVSQFLQNANQYQSDFDEAQRRWNLEQGWNQSTDQFNMGLAGRQQMSAEEQARLAAEQWNQQFGWTQQTDQWGRELGQGQLANAVQETANTGAYQTGILANTAQENRNTAAYQQGQLKNQAQANAIDQAYKSGQISLGQRQAALAELTQRQDYSIQQGQLGVQQQANAIDQAYKSGQISNEQRNLALQELTQRQTYGLQRQSMAEQVRATQAAEAMRQQEINQQMQIAAMQAYGRSTAPQAQWARSWA